MKAEPLWSDDRIGGMVDGNSFDVLYNGRIISVLRASEAEILALEMRDEYEAERAAPQASPAVMPDDVRATIEAALNVLRGTRLVDLWYHNVDQDIRGEPTDKVLAWLTLLPRDAADGPS